MLIFLIPLLLVSHPAWACDFQVAKFPLECQLQDRFHMLKQEFSTIGVDPEEITEYKALRFIDAHSFAKAKAANAPVEKIYEPAPLTWNTWLQGEKFARTLPQRIQKESLSSLHLASISKELMSTFALLKGSEPGKIRSSPLQLPPAFFVTCENKKSKSDLKNLMAFDIHDLAGQPLLDAHLGFCTRIDPATGITEVSEFMQGWVFYPSSINVPAELERWISAANKSWELLRSGKSNESPLRTIAHLQRWFVAIHPFGDGNGRVSRFIQDQILRSLNLPLVASGKLQDEFTLSEEQYAEAFIKVELETIEMLESCLSEHLSGSPSYGCRAI